MNITFLIGNGFDLNLGLATSYSDFIKTYTISKDTDSEIVSYFKRIINKDIELWSNAEEAFGKITKVFKDNGKTAEDFSVCHEDFCESLSKYLIAQEKRIRGYNNEIKKAFVSGINGFLKFFREAEKSTITKAMDNFGSGFVYNFINFNYTNTLRRFCESINNQQDLLGKRIYGNTPYANVLGNLINVHGTTKSDMVFGVHNNSQIADATLFDGFGGEYIAQIIKSKTDSANRQNTYNKAENVLMNSNLIYIYGMSIGVTDKYWWEKVCIWLADSSKNHLILHRYDAPERGLISRKFNTFERTIREMLLSNCTYNNGTKDEMSTRIHIDGSNIFKGLSGLATRTEESNEKESIIVG